MSRYLITTDVEELKRAEEEGLAKLVYQMSNPGRQYLYDQGGSLANVQPEQLKAADDRFEDQAFTGPKTPLLKEPLPRQKKISPSSQPASTSKQLDWFLGRWRDFIKSASPEEFRAEVERSKEYLPDGQSIIEYLQAFLDMLRNRHEHDYESAALQEVLGSDADAGDYIEDFKDSDAPQFRGKSKEKRKQMAIAAHASAKKRGKK